MNVLNSVSFAGTSASSPETQNFDCSGGTALYVFVACEQNTAESLSITYNDVTVPSLRRQNPLIVTGKRYAV